MVLLIQHPGQSQPPAPLRQLAGSACSSAGAHSRPTWRRLPVSSLPPLKAKLKGPCSYTNPASNGQAGSSTAHVWAERIRRAGVGGGGRRWDDRLLRLHAGSCRLAGHRGIQPALFCGCSRLAAPCWVPPWEPGPGASLLTIKAAAAGAAVEPQDHGVAGRAALRLHKVVVQVAPRHLIHRHVAAVLAGGQGTLEARHPPDLGPPVVLLLLPLLRGAQALRRQGGAPRRWVGGGNRSWHKQDGRGCCPSLQAQRGPCRSSHA